LREIGASGIEVTKTKVVLHLLQHHFCLCFLPTGKMFPAPGQADPSAFFACVTRKTKALMRFGRLKEQAEAWSGEKAPE